MSTPKRTAHCASRTAPTSRPILFSAPMVRALLDGRKTQTRRIVKAPRTRAIGADGKRCGDMLWDLNRAFADHGFPTDERGALLPMEQWKTAPADCYRNHYLHVPFAHPSEGWQADPQHDTRDRVYARWSAGDHLWVREAWRIVGWHEGEPLQIEYRDGVVREEDTDYSDDDRWVDWRVDREIECAEDCTKAGLKLGDGPDPDLYDWGDDPAPTRWRPSIHMPRWASRLTLEITSIRVERVQDISEADAIAEGMIFTPREKVSPGKVGPYGEEPKPYFIQPCQWSWRENATSDQSLGTARFAFANLWQHINGPESWAQNPWVWVVGFRRVGTGHQALGNGEQA